MLSRRIRRRVANARVLTTGYLAGRRLAFHKRGLDGSAKADAVHTGRADDVLWGVVYTLDTQGKRRLDEIELGYDTVEQTIVGCSGELPALFYVARSGSIDSSLKPYCWYHRYVIDGAVEHGLPSAYIRHVLSHPYVVDDDEVRRRRNLPEEKK